MSGAAQIVQESISKRRKLKWLFGAFGFLMMVANCTMTAMCFRLSSPIGYNIVLLIEACVISSALLITQVKLRSYQQKFALEVSTDALKVHFTICMLVKLARNMQYK